MDVKGFTALTQLEGDERAVEVLTAFRSLLRDICARRSVRIAKWLGDGAMLVCVEVQPLLEAIIELHHVIGEVSAPVADVAIRSGIASGDVILMEGDDYIGHCVNIAARLSDLAEGGEALADPSVMDALPQWGIALDYREIILRGVENPVRVARIGMATDGANLRRDPICGLPLSETTAAVQSLDGRGRTTLFCSSGCLDTWQRRPVGPSEAPVRAVGGG